MKKFSVKPFYRPASEDGLVEDGHIINGRQKIFGVYDCVSEPYSHSNPGIRYDYGLYGSMTSSQILRKIISKLEKKFQTENFPANLNLKDLLKKINSDVLCSIVKNPLIEAVAGACVSICQINSNFDAATLIIIGDCFAAWQAGDKFNFINNFDQAAFDLEQKGDAIFQECLFISEGDKGKAWDIYFSYFVQQQYFRANRNIGKGGHAMLNGDPNLLKCWSEININLSDVRWILLGTDGLIPAAKTNQANRSVLAQELGEKYKKGGLAEIIKWRDEIDYLPHIGGKGAWPEAAALELVFK